MLGQIKNLLLHLNLSYWTIPSVWFIPRLPCIIGQISPDGVSPLNEHRLKRAFHELSGSMEVKKKHVNKGFWYIYTTKKKMSFITSTFPYSATARNSCLSVIHINILLFLLINRFSFVKNIRKHLRNSLMFKAYRLINITWILTEKRYLI